MPSRRPGRTWMLIGRVADRLVVALEVKHDAVASPDAEDVLDGEAPLDLATCRVRTARSRDDDSDLVPSPHSHSTAPQ